MLGSKVNQKVTRWSRWHCCFWLKKTSQTIIQKPRSLRPMPEHSIKHKRVSIQAICILNKKKGIPASHSCLPLGRWVFHSHLLPRLGFYFVQLFFTTLVTYHPKGSPSDRKTTNKTARRFLHTKRKLHKNRNKKYTSTNTHQSQSISKFVSNFDGRFSIGLAPDFRWGFYLEEETLGCGWNPKKWWCFLILMIFLDFLWCLMIVVDCWWFLNDCCYIFDICQNRTHGFGESFLEAFPLHIPGNWP